MRAPWFLRAIGLLTQSLLIACGDGTVPQAAPSTPFIPDASPSSSADGSLPPTDAATGDATIAMPPLTPLPAPPSGGGLGATVQDDGGVAFGVWAPAASGVDVEGSFASQPIPLAPVDGGVFEATVAARAGDTYRYRVHDGTALLTRLDPRARDLDGGAGVIVDPRTFAWTTSGFTLGARNAQVIYELHVGSFSAAGAGHGTFASAIPHLDALKALGVTAIELMPSNDFGGDDGWGYNPASYFATHTSFGGADDLRRLVDAAHARGIGILLDVVYNHYGSTTGGPLDCFDGTCPNASAGVYFFSDPTYALTAWGPRPDFSNPRVSDFVADGAFAWIAESHVDGLRWDSVSNIRALDGSGNVPGGMAVLQRTNAAIHALRPDALLVAEDLKGYAAITAPTASGGFGFDAQWDGFGSIVSAVTATSDAARNIDAVKSALPGGYNGDPFSRVFYTQSHDTVGNGGSRLPTAISAAAPTGLIARKLSLLATTGLLTAPAVPMLFMGEEMLATGTFSDPPAPLDWTLATANAPILAFYTDAIRARRNLDGATPALLGANVNVFHVNEAAKVLAYERSDANGHVAMVVLNFGATAYASYVVGLPQGGTWQVRLNSDATRYGSDFGGASSAPVVASATARDGFAYSGSVALGSYAGLVLSP